jgi:hypothetical protein
MPSQFDRSLWVSKFAGGSGGQLMSGLRFLKLLEGEKPTDKLRSLVDADADERKSVLTEVLREAYSEDVIDKLPSMTPAMLNKALDDLGATEQTRRKAFSFLVNAAKAIDLPIADGIKKKARNKPSRLTGRRGGGRKNQDGKDRDGDQGTANHKNQEHDIQRTGMYSPLHILIDQLPQSRQWRKIERFRWLTALTGNLDWLVRQVPDPAGEAADGNNREAPGLPSQHSTPGASEGESHDV